MQRPKNISRYARYILNSCLHELTLNKTKIKLYNDTFNGYNALYENDAINYVKEELKKKGYLMIICNEQTTENSYFVNLLPI